MAVKLKPVKLSIKDLAQAVLDKKVNPKYINKTTWGPHNYSYEEDIYPQIRTAFEKIYPPNEYTNEEFTQRFYTDFYRKDQRVLQIIFPEGQAEPPEAGPVVAGESPATMEGGAASTPSIPKIPQGLTSFGQNLGSSAQIGLKRGLGRVGSGLGSIFGGVARGGGGMLVKAGGFGADALARASNQISRGSFIKGPGKAVWVFLGAFFLLFILGGVIGLPFGPQTAEAPGVVPSSNLAISLTGPRGCTDNCQVDNNQEISYEISLLYNGPGSADIEVSGKLPDRVNLSKADAENWNSSAANFSQVIPDLASKQERKLSLTVKPEDNKTNFRTATLVTATIVKANLPSSEACQTKYATVIAKNPDKINFGDPVCDFSKDDLYSMLKQQDPSNADFWYLKVVPCESSYNPNEYFRCDSAGNCTPDPAGAWGLFQMGRGRGGIYDHGDVAWQNQISNAINYNITKLQPAGLSIGSYWECAR